MKLRRTLIGALLVSLVGVGLWAQEPRARVYPRGVEPGQVLTGSDVGVRISSERGPRGEILGTLVVRADGQWVEVTSAPRVMYSAAPRSYEPAAEPKPPYTGTTPPLPADAFASRTFELTVGDDTTVVPGAEVTASFFATAKVKPLLGRFFVDMERGSSASVAVLSHELWMNRFDASPEIVGRRITIDGRALVVVGIAPRGFSEPDGARLWIPR